MNCREIIRHHEAVAHPDIVQVITWREKALELEAEVEKLKKELAEKECIRTPDIPAESTQEGYWHSKYLEVSRERDVESKDAIRYRIMRQACGNGEGKAWKLIDGRGLMNGQYEELFDEVADKFVAEWREWNGNRS